MEFRNKALLATLTLFIVGLIFVYQSNLIEISNQEITQLSQSSNSYASLTWYMSYPKCCKESPDYDPNWPTDECDDYSGCKYLGQFACVDGAKSFDWVKSHNIISFYDDSDPDGKHFQSKWCNKKLRVHKNGKVFDVVILDTCGNDDCDNCCHKNSKGGFLIDMEYYTAQKNLGDISYADGTIDFEVLGQEPMMK